MKLRGTIDPQVVRGHILALHHLQPYNRRRALWLALASAIILTAVMVLGAISPTEGGLEPNFHIAYIAVCNLVLYIVLYMYIFWLIRCGVKGWGLGLAGLGGSIAAAFLFSIAEWHVENSVYSNTSNTLVITLFVNMTASLIAYLITVLLVNVTRYQETLMENEHLHAENTRIRYESLEQQMSPHFLFNSLNTLDGLIGMDDEAAHRYLGQLAATYRYILLTTPTVTLADELDFCQIYICMMQQRFSDALTVDINVDKTSMTRLVPHISIQLLIENAIKHNIVSLRHPLNINITTTNDFISISNHIQHRQSERESTGLGLANLRERYRLLAGRDITITDDGDTFTVKLPLL